MSEHVIGCTLIGVLKSNQNIEKYRDNFESNIQLNYDATLIRQEFFEDYSYEFEYQFVSEKKLQKLKSEFISLLETDGILLDNRYDVKLCVYQYYNGADNPVDEMTVEDFLKIGE